MRGAPHRDDVDTRSGQFRFSDRFISRATTWLSVTLLAGGGVGVTLLIIGGEIDSEPLGIVGAVILFVFGLGPVLAAAVLGGLALHWTGAIVGVAFVAGLVMGPAGLVTENTALMIVGFAVLSAATLGYFALGFLRNVPMWIGARVLIRGGGPATRPRSSSTRPRSRNRGPRA